MLFSLDDSIERIFGISVTNSERSQIKRDIKLIRKRYRNDRGWMQYLKYNKKKILLAFELYCGFDHNLSKKVELWVEYCERALTEGAFFLDYLL